MPCCDLNIDIKFERWTKKNLQRSCQFSELAQRLVLFTVLTIYIVLMMNLKLSYQRDFRQRRYYNSHLTGRGGAEVEFDYDAYEAYLEKKSKN